MDVNQSYTISDVKDMVTELQGFSPEEFYQLYFFDGRQLAEELTLQERGVRGTAALNVILIPVEDEQA